ncbi:MAG TPA: L-rhamnose mutarotase [Candidatus Limnocylindrales bacterium]|nr:L-rhamnose mutarotase [Candidatus Limnocylindrales bacterium]
MERGLFHLRLFPGTETTFDRRLDPVPGDLADALRGAGLANVTAFRRGTDVWWYVESREGAADAALERLLVDPRYGRWRSSLVDVVAEPGPRELRRYRQVFHSDAPPRTGRFERGMFVLVVHPERIAEYDERHANPWPEMLEALAAAGFRNYSGFRDGSLVAYYGEFDPDMATALADIGATEVNRRWSESFRGIITAITDDEGRLFTAREVAHVD